VVNDEASRREKRAGMAIKFEGLSAAAEEALATLIARLQQPAEQAPVATATPAAPRRAAAPPEELHTAQQRISALEMEVSDLKGNIEAYEQQQRQLEADEQTARRLAERLAQEKAEAVARADKATQRASEEVQRLRAEVTAAEKGRGEDRQRVEALEATRERAEALEEEARANEAALDAERREHENTMAELSATRAAGSGQQGELAAVRAERESLKAERDDERLKVGRLERLLAEERAKTEQARAREREVRHLLTLVSERTTEVPDGDGSGSDGEASEPKVAPLEAEDAATDAAPPEIALEKRPESPDVLAWAMETMTPSKPAEASPAALDVDFDIAFQEPAAVDEDLPTPKDLSAFADELRAATRIIRTERYHGHTPTEPMEILVFDLLSRVETLADLEKWTQGRVTTDRLVQIVHGFHARSLIQLAQ
jgi:hypothetical protein